MPGCTAEAAFTLAERLRKAVESEPVHDNAASIAVTLSLGIATWDGMTLAPELLRTADSALYQAKRGGRNRAVQAAPSVPPLV